MNGDQEFEISCPSTSTWTNWVAASSPDIQFKAGENIIHVGGAAGKNGPNVDKIVVQHCPASNILNFIITR